MLVAVERFPEIHVVTYLDQNEDFKIVNRYEPKNAEAFYLHTGNSDPEIEFTQEFRTDDWTPEQLEEGRKFLQRVRHRKFSVVEIAAMNYSLHKRLNKV